jgi:hypothetical protein
MFWNSVTRTATCNYIKSYFHFQEWDLGLLRTFFVLDLLRVFYVVIPDDGFI